MCEICELFVAVVTYAMIMQKMSEGVLFGATLSCTKPVLEKAKQHRMATPTEGRLKMAMWSRGGLRMSGASS